AEPPLCQNRAARLAPALLSRLPHRAERPHCARQWRAIVANRAALRDKTDRSGLRESAVLTFACARALRASRLTAIAGAALTLPFISFASVRPATAEGVEIESCIGNGFATNCVTHSAPDGDPYI